MNSGRVTVIEQEIQGMLDKMNVCIQDLKKAGVGQQQMQFRMDKLNDYTAEFRRIKVL